MKVALYARVSTKEQAEKGTSIDTQVEALERYCQDPKRELEIYDWYKDKGYSGANLKRPELQRLLADARQGKFEKVLVYKTDRLARSIIHTVRLVLEYFDEWGIAFASTTEPYDTSKPTGKLFFMQLASFADFEREAIRERTREGRLRKVREGKWMGSNAHYAYDIDKNTKKLVLHKERAKTFKWVVDELLSGRTCYDIVKEMNDRGVPTWKQDMGWKMKGIVHIWRESVLERMLKNPIIMGKGQFGGIPIKAPAIVSEEEFRQIGAQLKENCSASMRNTKHFYLLRGLLYCKRCGFGLNGYKRLDRRKKKVYFDQAYHCPSMKYERGGKSCGLRRLNLPKIEAFVWNRTKELITDSEKLKKAIKGKHFDLAANKLFTDDKIKGYNATIGQSRKELDKLLSLYSRSEIFTLEEWEAKAGDIKAKIQEAEKARDRLLEAKDRILAKSKHLDNALEYFRSISSRLDSFTNEEKSELVHALWTCITVDWNEERKVHTLEMEGAISSFASVRTDPENRPTIAPQPSPLRRASAYPH